MVSRFSKKYRKIIRFAAFVLIVVALNYVANFIFFRIDLTSDRRYTLTDVSKQVMQQIDNPLLVRVYLDGEMSLEMKKLRTTIKETLDELKQYSNGKLRYEFVDIVANTDPRDIDQMYANLQNSGITPIIMQENAADGSRSERALFPGAHIIYTKQVQQGESIRNDTRQVAVNFLQNDAAEVNSDESLLIAQQNVETVLVGAINRISKKQTPHIAFVEGHSELDEYEIGDICKELADFAKLERVSINEDVNALQGYAAVIIAKPTLPWSDADKLVLDQYIMAGGRVAWFIDAVDVPHDSLSRGEYTFALASNHQLDELLFKYGIRINPTVISDLQCAFLPINIAPAGQTADFKPAPWVYYPLLVPPDNHAITRGLNLIESKYPSTIDTIGKVGIIQKTILLHSSEYSRTQIIPVPISLTQASQRPDPSAFQKSYLPVAALLEGHFSSAFLNRPLDRYNHQRPFNFKPSGEYTKMIVVADGDVIRNDVSRRADGTRIFPLGFDRYMNVQFGNRGFVKNCIYYLLDDDNTMQIRRREWQLRTLDKTKIYPQRNYWKGLNTILPIALTLLAGLFFTWLRKRKYATRQK